MLSYAKWQGSSSFHEFLHGKQNNDIENLPPISVKNGCQQICVQLVKQCIGEENVILNQPVSHISIFRESIADAHSGLLDKFQQNFLGCFNVPKVLKYTSLSHLLDHN